MCSNGNEAKVTIRGVEYKKHIILADAYLPYKFTIDRNRNNIFFCINADEYSDQSFHSVILNLDRGSTAIVPEIRNGFASAIDQTTGRAYLGGSDGIFSYNYFTNNVDKPALVTGDIFDMFYQNHLYFVDTATQALQVLKNGEQKRVPYLEGHLIHHFVVDEDRNIFFIDPSGLYMLKTGQNRAVLLDDGEMNYRGVTLDKQGIPYLIAQDGIYSIDADSGRPERLLPLENGFGLAFDMNNNIIYSEERTVITLNRC